MNHLIYHMNVKVMEQLGFVRRTSTECEVLFPATRHVTGFQCICMFLSFVIFCKFRGKFCPRNDAFPCKYRSI
jgi:hypothetical protein